MAVTTITLTQLRNGVLQRLRVLGAGQTASAEDASTVEDAIAAEFAKLLELSLIDFTTSTIPQSHYDPLRFIVATNLAADFAIPSDEHANWEANLTEWRGELAALKANTRVGTPTPSVYF